MDDIERSGPPPASHRERSGALGSPLGRRAGRAKPSAGELRDMRAAAWHRQGIVVLRPADIGDDWTRQALVNEANRLYGRREG